MKILYYLLSFTLFLSCNYNQAKIKSDESFDIILIIGQSNTENGYPIDPSIDKVSGGILQLGRI
ncbi:MAG: hypothetical protein H7321_09870 [Bacteroidia bacterium]|nr:hypothetical protein [Bacteroidia bacterium]